MMTSLLPGKALGWIRRACATPAFRDGVGFVIAVFIGNIVILHGKAVSHYLFSQGQHATNSGFHHFWIYAVVLDIAVLLQLLRLSDAWSDIRGTWSIIVVVLGPMAIQALSSWPSMLVFFMQIYLTAILAIIVVVEPVLRTEMPREFWELFFQGGLRAIKYVLVLFTAGVAVLQYLSSGLQEATDGFLTSLFYPTITLVVSIGFIAQWILFPAWTRLLQSYSSGSSGQPGGADNER